MVPPVLQLAHFQLGAVVEIERNHVVPARTRAHFRLFDDDYEAAFLASISERIRACSSWVMGYRRSMK